MAILPRVARKVVPSLRFERELWADGPRDRGRRRRGRPGRVGRPDQRRRRRPAQGPAGQQGARLQDAHRDRARAAVRPHRRLVRRRGPWATPARTSATTSGMSEAQRLAARRAIDGLGVDARPVLIDGNWDFVGGGNAMRIVKGDARCLSIAAASILAKVTRDRIMRERGRALPGLRLRPEQGLPVPPPQDGAQGVGPDVDPPPHLGLHGPPAVGRQARRRKPSPPCSCSGRRKPVGAKRKERRPGRRELPERSAKSAGRRAPSAPFRMAWRSGQRAEGLRPGAEHGQQLARTERAKRCE